MAFTNDTVIALRGAAALVNTMPGARDAEGIAEPDRLTSHAELAAFTETWQWTGTRRRDATELAQVRALRPRLRAAWEADSDEDCVTVINALLREGGALPQLVRHGDVDWHIHATNDAAPLATRMAVEAAMGLVDVVRSGERDRMRICAADDCHEVLIDFSRNRSRRFCESGCGNRLNVAAYRERLRERT